MFNINFKRSFDQVGQTFEELLRKWLHSKSLLHALFALLPHLLSLLAVL